MNNSKLSTFLTTFAFFKTAKGIPMLLLIAFTIRLLFLGTSYIAESLVFIALTCLYGYSLFIDQRDRVMQKSLEKEITELKNFISQFQLNKTVKETYEQKPKLRRF